MAQCIDHERTTLCIAACHDHQVCIKQFENFNMINKGGERAQKTVVTLSALALNIWPQGLGVPGSRERNRPTICTKSL